MTLSFLLTSPAKVPATRQFIVINLFAVSCNMHYWILRHVPNTESLAFEFDPPVYELSKRNIARLDRKIELEHGEYL